MKKIMKIILTPIISTLCIVITVFAIAYVVKGNIDDVELPQGFEEKVSEDSFENTGDVRIMSSNILVDYKSWGGCPVKPRAKKYLEVIDAYKPDVIGVQEFCECWFCCLNNNLSDGYRLLYPLSTGALFRMTSMIYNSDTLDVVESGTFAYENGDPRLRRVVWAVFEVKETDKRFAVTNTHLDFLREGQELQYTAVMKSQRDELLNCIDDLSERFDCPVFSVGDFNSIEDSPKANQLYIPEIYNSLAEKLVDTKFVSENQICGTERSWKKSSFDHIFMKGDAEINSFCLMSYDYLSDMSDHYPIFADVTL